MRLAHHFGAAVLEQVLDELHRAEHMPPLGVHGQRYLRSICLLVSETIKFCWISTLKRLTWDLTKRCISHTIQYHAIPTQTTPPPPLSGS